ncbi:MAG TPA: hypothetical protein ENN40_04305 [Candidatus Aminicenantes bacterium]|nr:hypothetical protein [Candidatus Aminicenantes bacterium]
MRYVKAALVLLGLAALFLIQACGGDGYGYVFKIAESDGTTAVSGSFSGNDHNGDGAITKEELESFREEAALHFVFSQAADWKKSFTPESLPKIIHGLNDLQAFRFELEAFAKGEPSLEFKTNTKETVEASGYHFWRKVDLSDKTSGPTLVNGVGDGTQGLELSMRTLEDASVKVTRK